MGLVTVVYAAGCGSDGGGTVRAKDGKVRVVITEYQFSPSQILAKPGRLQLEAKNAGALAHNLIVLKGRKRYLAARTPTFQRGSRTIKTRLRRGTYVFVSNVGKDEELGLRGKIRVR